VDQDPPQLGGTLPERGVEDDPALPQKAGRVNFPSFGCLPGKQLAAMRPRRGKKSNVDRKPANLHFICKVPGYQAPGDV
jgi:hypothetical protein